MSYSHALDGQIDLRQYYRTGPGRERLYSMFAGAVAEGRLGGGSGNASFEDYLNTVMIGVDDGTPAYWAPDMCSLLESVATSMPPWTLRRDSIPDERGLLWFAKPLAMPDWPIAGRRDLRAIGFDSLGGFLVLAFWFEDDEWRHPFPSSALSWRYGTIWQQMLAVPSDQHIVIEHGQRHERLGQYIAAALALMEQRIIVSTPERAARATRKRAAQVWEHEPLVRVVQLRRTTNPSPHHGQEPEPVEWSCSWVVRGHWRQQACGEGHAERRPVFVLPHVKGDRSKPLKPPGDRVFAVVR